ncbi:MAG: TetR/AcrR family transcriptional regulator [Candidatus Izimaplasma sp.]|nr:TetR/AcrR family transcriptional regulator [Candidatus Izimaplasma bacterium]
MYQIEKVDMRVKYTREWTFEALYRLLEVKKYENIKISEIIIKAGISRATFYRNFSMKDDIVKIKVKNFFDDFFAALFEHLENNGEEDEFFLIQAFFKRIDEEEKLINTVINTKLDYLMVAGILKLINIRREQFYSIIKTNKVTELYTMEIVANSAWNLLSRWQISGKEETSSELSKMYLSAFKSIYIALFKDKEELNK